MTKTQLLERYNSNHDECCKCGCVLTASSFLGEFFIMDYEGNFYCTECDIEFVDGDERIFEPDLYDDEEDEE